MTNETELTFEDFALKFSKPLLRYLTRMTRNSADADDLLQETLIRVASELPHLRSSEAIKEWTYRIATNVAIDFLRKTKRAHFEEFSDEIAVSESDEDDGFIVDEMNDCIRGVIDRLPPDYRAAIILSDLQGQTVAETAQIMDISIPAAKVRIHRARKRLKESLNKKCDFYRSADGNLRCKEKGNAGGLGIANGRPFPGKDI
jgi:RNA polymerase sigma-70 factor (ECF subfamily)